MWVAAVDFQKAFDSMRHGAIWRSLRNHSISERYICLLKKLYADQHATVLTDVESEELEIARGTKQGGPLSSLLFNLVLQFALEEDTGTWNEKGLGIKYGDETRVCISNLRFADDILLMANSLSQLKRMMTDVKRSTEAQVLEIHPDNEESHQPNNKQTERNRD